jgi:hypothetical protein
MFKKFSKSLRQKSCSCVISIHKITADVQWIVYNMYCTTLTVQTAGAHPEFFVGGGGGGDPVAKHNFILKIML